jgi:lipoprotein-releasing system ATP-binding protein
MSFKRVEVRMSLLLEAANLHKTFFFPEKLHLLQGISLKVKKKSSIAIMGASGEGKTTLLHILGTLESFDSGHLKIAGKNIDKINKPFFRNQHVGFVFQFHNLLDDLTTLENVLMPAKIGRKKIDINHGMHLLTMVRLENKAHIPARLLSGGEKQRAAIARCLCNSPELILADEPSGNLDHENSKIVHQLLLDCVKKEEKTLIIVTHDEELAYLCDEMYILQSGILTLRR